MSWRAPDCGRILEVLSFLLFDAHCSGSLAPIEPPLELGIELLVGAKPLDVRVQVESHAWALHRRRQVIAVALRVEGLSIVHHVIAADLET